MNWVVPIPQMVVYSFRLDWLISIFVYMLFSLLYMKYYMYVMCYRNMYIVCDIKENKNMQTVAPNSSNYPDENILIPA